MRLTPTLWKSDRVVGNPIRLNLFRLLCENRPRTVSATADILHVSVGTCSLYLKHLQARGLLRAERQGVLVYYRIEPDPKVAQAAGLVSVIKDFFRADWRDKDIIAVFQALRNPGAVAVVRLLREKGALDEAAICAELDLPGRTFRRYRRRLVAVGILEPHGEAFRIPPAAPRPIRKLVDLTLL